ncbi:MAG: ArsI/CadI family heavy metal resistance metalloenzyme [Actinomycetota bacterium]
MSRFQLSLNVDDVEGAVEFYSALLGVGPAKHRPGYANFVVEDPPLKLVVIEDEGEPGTLNHLGIELPDGEAVAAETARIDAARLPVAVDDPHTCCFATQEKAWTRDPDGVPWEIYTVTADTERFGASPRGDTPVDRILPPLTLDQFRLAVADPDVVVIDAQGKGGFGRAHIEGAVGVELDDVLGQASRLVPSLDTRIVVYCTDQQCLGSEFVGTQLVEAGYLDVGRFPGGVAAWAEAGLPVAAAEGATAAEEAWLAGER